MFSVNIRTAQWSSSVTRSSIVIIVPFSAYSYVRLFSTPQNSIIDANGGRVNSSIQLIGNSSDLTINFLPIGKFWAEK